MMHDFQGYTPFMCSDTQLCPIVCDPIDYLACRGSCLWDSPGEKTGVGCAFPPAGALPHVD